MKRSGMPPRTTRIARGTTRIRPKKPRTAAEERAEFAREFGSVERVEWIRWHGCVGCARVPCENHHTKNGGRSRRADACWIVPACFDCHTDIHANGVRTYERAYADMLGGQTLRQHAARYDAAYRAFLGAQGAS